MNTSSSMTKTLPKVSKKHFQTEKENSPVEDFSTVGIHYKYVDSVHVITLDAKKGRQQFNTAGLANLSSQNLNAVKKTINSNTSLSTDNVSNR